MYSIHNKGKSVAAERFIRTLKNKIFKHMTVISKNVYFDVLDDIVNKYNNTVHRTIKMKPIDVKDNTYADSKNLCEKLFLRKDTHQVGLKNLLLLIQLNIQFHGHILLMILIVKKLLEHFLKKNSKRLTKKNSE